MLKSQDGTIAITGNLLGFDGEFYRVDTVYGELTVDGTGVFCEGPGCPDLENYIAHLSFSGSPTIGRNLMPALLEAFALKYNYELLRTDPGATEMRFTFRERGGGAVLGEFAFRLSDSDEAFANLISNEADVAMTLREPRPEELTAARDVGLGNLSDKGRMRVLALDAFIPVVAPDNPVQEITLSQLSKVLSGEMARWSDLGGPDAPIDLHLWNERTGLEQKGLYHFLAPVGSQIAKDVTFHADGASIARAVSEEPFSLGLTTLSEQGNSSELALNGECGFTLSATRWAVKTEDFPLTAPLFLYLPARRFPKLGREFLSYLRDPSAQLVIRSAGFVDQAPEQIEINAQGDRLANAIARAGEEVPLEELQRMIKVLTPLKRLTSTFRFKAGSTELDAQSRANVEQVALELDLGLYDMRRLVFIGFSDGEGAADSNRAIALRRAEVVRGAVQDALNSPDSTRFDLAVESFGEAMPMACDDTEWGRQVNRRVEIWLR